jgi:hypothetical protein
MMVFSNTILNIRKKTWTIFKPIENFQLYPRIVQSNRAIVMVASAVVPVLYVLCVRISPKRSRQGFPKSGLRRYTLSDSRRMACARFVAVLDKHKNSPINSAYTILRSGCLLG